MSYNDDEIREIKQLWIIAKYYFNKAIEYYHEINNAQLSLTVKEIAEKFKTGNEILGLGDVGAESA